MTNGMTTLLFYPYSYLVVNSNLTCRITGNQTFNNEYNRQARGTMWSGEEVRVSILWKNKTNQNVQHKIEKNIIHVSRNFIIIVMP